MDGPLARDEIAEAGAVLGRAFRDDPAYVAVFAHLPDAGRADAVIRVKRGFTAAAVRHHQTDAVRIDDRIAAAALIVPPGQWPLAIRPWIDRAIGCLRGPRATVRFLRLELRLHAWHLREPHYYLFVLGVAPELQGRGLGKRLLGRLNERADAAGVPCYLETDLETNVRIYERAGYRVVTDEGLPELGGLRMWTMVRPPRGSR